MRDDEALRHVALSHFLDQSRDENGPARAHGVAHGEMPAIYVDDFRIDIVPSVEERWHDRERFHIFDQIDVAKRAPGFREQFFHRSFARCQLVDGVAGGLDTRLDPGQRRSAEYSTGFPRAEHNEARAIRDGGQLAIEWR